jgi:hypothetical protein
MEVILFETWKDVIKQTPSNLRACQQYMIIAMQRLNKHPDNRMQLLDECLQLVTRQRASKHIPETHFSTQQ